MLGGYWATLGVLAHLISNSDFVGGPSANLGPQPWSRFLGLHPLCQWCPSFTHYRGTKVFSGLWLLSHLSQTSDLSAQYYWQVQYSAHWLRVLHLLRHHVADLLSFYCQLWSKTNSMIPTLMLCVPAIFMAPH